MRFDSGPGIFVRVIRNYVLTEYVLNENDCNTKNNWKQKKEIVCEVARGENHYLTQVHHTFVRLEWGMLWRGEAPKAQRIHRWGGREQAQIVAGTCGAGVALCGP